MDNIAIALEIMGMGMLGLFTAMVVIMAVTSVLKRMDNSKKQK